MPTKPYASDWVRLNEHTEYSPSLQLYWHKCRVYDQLSASHNGIIGAGADLARIIKENKHDWSFKIIGKYAGFVEKESWYVYSRTVPE